MAAAPDKNDLLLECFQKTKEKQKNLVENKNLDVIDAAQVLSTQKIKSEGIPQRLDGFYWLLPFLTPLHQPE